MVMSNLKEWENTPHSTPIGDPASQTLHGCVILIQGGCEGCGHWLSLLWRGRRVTRLVLVFFFLFFNIYLFLAVPGLPCCAGFSRVVARGGYSLGAVLGFLIAVTSSDTEHGLWARRPR